MLQIISTSQLSLLDHVYPKFSNGAPKCSLLQSQPLPEGDGHSMSLLLSPDASFCSFKNKLSRKSQNYLGQRWTSAERKKTELSPSRGRTARVCQRIINASSLFSALGGSLWYPAQEHNLPSCLLLEQIPAEPWKRLPQNHPGAQAQVQPCSQGLCRPRTTCPAHTSSRTQLPLLQPSHTSTEGHREETSTLPGFPYKQAEQCLLSCQETKPAPP